MLYLVLSFELYLLALEKDFIRKTVQYFSGHTNVDQRPPSYDEVMNPPLTFSMQK